MLRKTGQSHRISDSQRVKFVSKSGVKLVNLSKRFISRKLKLAVNPVSMQKVSKSCLTVTGQVYITKLSV